MCGIAGVISWDGKYRVTRETLQRMSAAIAHRGPDGEGFYLNHDAEVTPDHPQCGFAFRRLAILDPDPRAMQPFTIGQKTIVFNGEIYNFRELREELKKLRPDYPWRTTGDTEVLLLAYDAWGEECVERLNGMFAFAVWDEANKKVFLARDRMGQKPLFVHSLDQTLFFASELAAMPRGGAPSVHPIWWGDYLRYGCLAGITPWLDVAEVSPGSWVRRNSAGKSECETYFSAGRIRGPRVGDEAAISSTRSLVRKAVDRQLVSDVPLGVFLSGGIDSSVVAAAARRAGPVKTFSVGFDDPRYDESRYARDVAVHLGTEHHEYRVRANAVEDLHRLVQVFGEPFGDSSALPTHYLARATRAEVKVALSGDGGDELFGGYDRYRAMKLGKRMRSLRVLEPVAARIATRHPKKLSTRVGRFLKTIGGTPRDRYDGYVRVFDEPTLRSLAPDAQFSFPLVAEAYDIALRSGSDIVEAALACDRMRYLPDDLLTKVDRASMLHGLEVRSPFMDHELVEFAAGLTTDQLLKGGPKRMLREAFADDLPAWVFKRKKMGFAVPIGEWFRGELRAMLRDNLFASDSFARQHFVMPVVERLVDEHERQAVDHSQRLYALLMLELWWRTSR
jgi:asparagine synthase (glutamine-hydrolysing)